MFRGVNEKRRDAQRDVNAWLSGQGRIGVWVVLAVLAAALLFFIAGDLLT